MLLVDPYLAAVLRLDVVALVQMKARVAPVALG
jgi:hypothetical protein